MQFASINGSESCHLFDVTNLISKGQLLSLRSIQSNRSKLKNTSYTIENQHQNQCEDEGRPMGTDPNAIPFTIEELKAMLAAPESSS